MQINTEVLLDNLRDIFWAMDENGNILYINDACYDILGYRAKDVIGRPLFELMCPQHIYREGSCVRLVEQMQGRNFHKELLWMLHSNGDTRVVIELNSKRITNADGKMEIHGLGRDITERVALEKATKQNSLNTLKALVVAVEAKDAYTQGHSLRVAEYANILGKALNLTQNQLEELEMASMLHDIGKIGVNDSILTKKGLLTKEEYKLIQEHPAIGSRIVSSAGFTKDIINAVQFHHKRYDGLGYPKDVDLVGDDTYVCIIGAVDALDAMTSRRTYKPILMKKQVVDEFHKQAGKQFCPIVVEVLVRLLTETDAFAGCIVKGDDDLAHYPLG